MKSVTTTRFELTQDEVRAAIAEWFNKHRLGEGVSSKDVWTRPSENGNPAATITICSAHLTPEPL